MAGYGDQIHVEIRGLTGKIGEVHLDPGATAWDLARQVHSNIRLPCGMFWKLAIENELVADKGMPMIRVSEVTCVKCAPARHEQEKVVRQVQDLLRDGRPLDELSLESHLVWHTLQSLTFGRNFNQSMENVTLSSGLQSLTFCGIFNQSMENVTLPSGLQSLTFGSTRAWRM